MVFDVTRYIGTLELASKMIQDKMVESKIPALVEVNLHGSDFQLGSIEPQSKLLFVML